jgi:DNA-binding HxlR family transcriptional regulator
MPDPLLRPIRQVPRPEEIFDPVARGLDVIGDRWTLVLVGHLLGARRGFQELRKRTGIAPRVLSARLRQLIAAGFIESVVDGSRAAYALTEQGRSLAPIVGAIARWWIRHGLEALDVDAGRFTETSAQSVLESLPFMVDEEASRDVDLTFEIRLTGSGGGVWTVRVHHGECTVQPGFAERADVRYTADARVWCGVALGLVSAREAFAAGRLVKEGGQQAMDRYFHQVSRGRRAKTREARTRRPATARSAQRSIK